MGCMNSIALQIGQIGHGNEFLHRTRHRVGESLVRSRRDAIVWVRNPGFRRAILRWLPLPLRERPHLDGAAQTQRAGDTYVEGGGGGVSFARMVPSFAPG